MLKIGETVRYGQSGLCTVQEKCEKEIGGEVQEYYVLIPFSKKGSMVFVPCGSSQLLEKISLPLTKDEIDSLIKSVLDTPTQWIRDFRRRSDFSKKALASSDRKDPLLLIKTIYDHRSEESAGPVRIHTTDDYFLRDAEYLVYSEIAFALGKEYSQVEKEMRALFCPEKEEK